MLNAIDRFWAAAAWSNFQNLGMIATLICWRWFPNAAYAAAWGVLLGGFAQLFFMLWAAKRDRLDLRIVWPRWTAEVREFFAALGAVTLGTATTLIAPMIDTVLASFLATGSRTALYYGDRINQLPLGVLGIALGTVLLPQMSARLAKDDRAGSDAAQNNAAALTLLLTLPFAAVFATIPDQIMTAIFAHGAFNAHAAAQAATALAAYGAGLPAMALVRIFASTFYARHDTATPARITFIAFGANIAMKLLLVWGVEDGRRRHRARHRLRRLAERRPVDLDRAAPWACWWSTSGFGALFRRRSWRRRRPARAPMRECISPRMSRARPGSGICPVGRGGRARHPLLRDRGPFVPAYAALGAPGAELAMQRLFVALSIPDDVAQIAGAAQSGVPGARWQTREQLHLTLRFVGEVDGRDANAIHDVLSAIAAPRLHAGAPRHRRIRG